MEQRYATSPEHLPGTDTAELRRRFLVEDLIKGASNRSAVATLVERTSRFVLIGRMEGLDAQAAQDCFERLFNEVPKELKKTLTYDRGTEMARHRTLTKRTGVKVFFCDPRSPWQRGTNENTNGLLRQYFPKGTDLSKHSPDDLAAVAAALNGRPRKTLGWKTPAEALDRLLLSSEQDGVATTG